MHFNKKLLGEYRITFSNEIFNKFLYYSIFLFCNRLLHQNLPNVEFLLLISVSPLHQSSVVAK